MTASRTTSRIIILLLFLAGLLLLKKPLFGEAAASAPAHISVALQGVATQVFLKPQPPAQWKPAPPPLDKNSRNPESPRSSLNKFAR